MKFKFYLRAFFLLLSINLFATLAFAQNKVFCTEMFYEISKIENQSIAKEIAFIEAKENVIVTALPYIEKLMKDKQIDLTQDQLQILASYFADFEYAQKLETTNNEETGYAAKLRMTVLPEKLSEKAINVSGKIIVDDYKNILEQIKIYKKQLESYKKQLKEVRINNEVVKSKVTDLEKLLQGLIFYYNGFGFFLKGENALAIKEFTKCIKVDPSHIKAYSYRAKSYQLAGDIDAAIEDCYHIITIDPSNEKAYYNLGTMFIGKGKDDLGFENLSKAIVLNPSFSEAYNNRGAINLRKKQFDLAIEDFTKAISLNTNDPNIYHNRAFAEYKKGNSEGAIKDASMAIKLNPNYAEAYFVRGLSYIEILDVENGVPDVVKACKYNFDDACKYIDSNLLEKAEYKKAWSLYFGHDIEKALVRLEKINKPNDERTILLLGLIYIEQNKPQEALNAISKIRGKIEKAYSQIVSKPEKKQFSEEDIQDIKDYYHYMLYASGSAYYKLNNCNKAIEDLEIFTVKYENVTASDMLGICYALAKEYAISIKYFMQGFSILEKQEKRNLEAYNTEAYNIASVYALMHNADESIHWAIIPLEYDRKLWLEKIKADRDFEHIRNKQKFKNFIIENERLLTK